MIKLTGGNCMKRLLLVVIILLVLPLTGCIKKYTATDQQSDEIAEYMAGLLLNNDEYYDEKLVTTDKTTGDSNSSTGISQTPSLDPNSGVTQAPNNAGATDTTKVKSITDVIGDNNFDIKYKSFNITDTYPDNSDNALFVINHSDGYKLLVVTFTITNTTGSECTLNLSDGKVDYQIDLNSDIKYSTALTLLENDLKYIKVKIAGGKSKNAILIFEVPDKADTSNISLIASKDNKSVTIKVK